MLVAHEQHYLAVPFVMLTADEFSETMGLVGWGWSISINVVRIGTYFWPLGNIAPSLSSMADNITLQVGP